MTADDPASPNPATWSEWIGGIVVANVVLIALECMVYRALAPIERGEPDGGAVWTPIAIIYELFGFGAAISVLPSLWLVLMSIIGWQTYMRIKQKRSSSADYQNH